MRRVEVDPGGAQRRPLQANTAAAANSGGSDALLALTRRPQQAGSGCDASATLQRRPGNTTGGSSDSGQDNRLSSLATESKDRLTPDQQSSSGRIKILSTWYVYFYAHHTSSDFCARPSVITEYLSSISVSLCLSFFLHFTFSLSVQLSMMSIRRLWRRSRRCGWLKQPRVREKAETAKVQK